MPIIDRLTEFRADRIIQAGAWMTHHGIHDPGHGDTPYRRLSIVGVIEAEYLTVFEQLPGADWFWIVPGFEVRLSFHSFAEVLGDYPQAVLNAVARRLSPV